MKTTSSYLLKTTDLQLSSTYPLAIRYLNSSLVVIWKNAQNNLQRIQQIKESLLVQLWRNRNPQKTCQPPFTQRKSWKNRMIRLTSRSRKYSTQSWSVICLTTSPIRKCSNKTLIRECSSKTSRMWIKPSRGVRTQTFLKKSIRPKSLKKSIRPKSNQNSNQRQS